MTFKKVVALCIAVCLLVSALTACGNAVDGKETAPSTSGATKEPEKQTAAPETTAPVEEDKGIVFPLEETVEYTGGVILNAGQYKMADSLAWQVFEKNTNISVEFTDFQNAEKKEKINLMMTGGTYPDFFLKCTLGIGSDIETEGIAIPLEDMIREHMPNLCAKLDEMDAWGQITSSDGHIYSLPQFYGQQMLGGNAPLWINKQWMDDLKLEAPKSLDDLYKIFKAFKDNDCNGNGDPNDEIPFTLTASNSWFPAKRLLAYLDDGIHAYDSYTAVIDGKLVFYPLTEGFKDNFLSFLVKLNKEGLLDPEAFTQSQEQSSVKGMAENIYGCFFRTSPDAQAPADNVLDYVILKPFKEGTLYLTNGINPGTLVITDKCKNPEILLAAFDYFYTQEGGVLARLGVENETYELNDKGEWKAIVNDLNEHTINGTAGWPGIMPQLNYKVDSYANPNGAFAHAERQALYKTGVIMPTVRYTEDETQKIADLKADIFGYIDTYTAQVITGQLDLESSWADFQKTLKEMKAEELETVYRTAYERTVANK